MPPCCAIQKGPQSDRVVNGWDDFETVALLATMEEIWKGQRTARSTRRWRSTMNQHDQQESEQKYADEEGLMWAETSAKTGEGVNEIFTAIGEYWSSLPHHISDFVDC